jgi:hypothetical protein
MTMKHLAVGLSAIALFSLVASGRTKAEILSLDCSISGRAMFKVWVDTGKSTATLQNVNSANPSPPQTYPAQVTITSFSWSGGNKDYTDSYSIDRTTGTFTGFTNYGATFNTELCVKGTSPLPATKF